MSHHLEAFGADGIHNLGAFKGVCYLQLLLKKDGRLLVRGPYDAVHEHSVRRRGGRVK